METRIFKVYGKEGHRQRESFKPSYSFKTLNGNRVEVSNSDLTNTNEYSILSINASSSEECIKELEAQLADGIFENSKVGKVIEL